MDFNFFFGPDKTSFMLSENGMVEENSTMPFHGIISRGLLNKLIDSNVSNEVWYNNAVSLERENLNSDLNSEDLLLLCKYAAECKTLTFGQSAICVKLYMVNYFDKLLTEEIADCEIWNIKEGHTSSVWNVSFVDSSSKEIQFIINVARDYEAGIELKETSEIMQSISNQCPNVNMAEVYDIRKILLNNCDKPYKVVVTRNEFIENSYEIHEVSNNQNGMNEYLLVERFLTKENNPAQIFSIYGRRFSEDEQNKIKNNIDLFITSASKCISHIPTINVNEGDVVWDGERAIVVAVSK